MSKIKFISGKNVLWEFIISEKNKMSMPLDIYLRKIEDYVSDEGQSDDENMPVYIEYDIVKKCPIYKGKPIDDRFIFSFVERFNEKFPHMNVNEKIFKAYLKSGWLRRISPLDK